MTAPVLPLLQGSTTRDPTRPPQASKPRAVSEFYERYLMDQLNAIDLRGGTAADKQQFMDMELRRPMSAAPVLSPEALGVDVPQWYRGASMAVLQGATFGFGDEAVGALLGTLTGVGARAGIDEYRAEYEAWAKANYKTALAGEIVGSILTAKAPLGVGKLIAGSGPQTFWGTLGRGIAFGAAAGAGAGTGDFSAAGLGDRTRAALFGATAGGVLGAGIGAVGGAARPLIAAGAERSAMALEAGARRIQDATPTIASWMRTPLRAFTPEGQALEILRKELADARISPQEAKQRAAALLHAGVPATVLELGSEPLQGLARNVFGNASPAVTEALEQLGARQEAQSARLVGGLLNTVLEGRKLGIQNIWNATSELHAAGLARSAPFYTDAFEQTVSVSERMFKLLQHPALRKAWNIGAKLAGDETLAGMGHGLPVNALAKKGMPSELPVRGIDYMKRGLDALVRSRAAAGRMSIRDRQHESWSKMLDEVVEETIDQIPSYGKALAAYSGPMRSRDAIEAGAEILKKPWHQVHKEILALSPNDRDFYRAGAARAYYEEMLKSRHSAADLAAKFFGGSVGQAGRANSESLRIQALFLNNKPAANAFQRLVAGEAAVSHSGGRTMRLPTSTSVEKIKEAAEGQVLPVRGQIGLTVATAGIAAVKRSRARISQEVNDALASMFVRGLQDPTHLFILLDDLAHVPVRGKIARGGTRALTSLAGSAVGAQTR